jgi:hypothetical protein
MFVELCKQLPAKGCFKLFFTFGLIVTKPTHEHTFKEPKNTVKISGWPVTLLGSELWTCYGVMKDSPIVSVDGVQFTFSESSKPGKAECLSFYFCYDLSFKALRLNLGLQWQQIFELTTYSCPFFCPRNSRF